MRENLKKNILVVVECKNPLGMPVTYRKKISECELNELRLQKGIDIISIKRIDAKVRDGSSKVRDGSFATRFVTLSRSL